MFILERRENMGRIALNERLVGYDSNGKKCIICDFVCDTVSDLPAQTVYTDYVLMIGCTARMIDSGDVYKIDSLGTWNLSQAGTGTYTKSEIDNLLSAKQNVLTFDSTPTQESTNPVTSGGIWIDQERQDVLQNEDRAALVELVDACGKNRAQTPDGGADSETSWATVSANLTANTQYIISFASLTSDDTDSTTIQIRFYKEGGSDKYIQVDRGTNVSAAFTLSADTNLVRIYKADSNAHGSGDTMSFYGLMICTKAAWDVSHAYQPYRPSYQELYEMVLALQ